MAAQEYFASFGPQQQRPQNNTAPPLQYRPPPTQQPFSSSQNLNQPMASPYSGAMVPHQPQQQPQQQQQYRPPYPDDRYGQPSPVPYIHNQMPPQYPNNSSNYLGAPLRPHRSYSEPPDDRRPSYVEPTHHKHRHHHRRRRDDGYSSGSESPSRSRSRSQSRSYSRSRSQSRPRSSRGRDLDKSTRNRNTFLGAGGGSIIGDLILPGMGTLGGLLLGGWGGHEYPTHKRSKSEHSKRRRSEQDRRNGITVHSGWVDR